MLITLNVVQDSIMNKEMIMKKLLITALLVLGVATTSFAGTWCKWDGSQPTDCLRDRNGVIYVGTAGISGGEANFNSHGFYEKVITRPALVDGNMYTSATYTFDGTTITGEMQQEADPENTLQAAKIRKYQEVRRVADAQQAEECSYSGFTIPQKTRTLMAEAISANKTMTYEAINESTGFYQGFERTPAQAQAVLDACLTDYETANQKLYVDNPDSAEADDSLVDDIKACVDHACVEAINWNYKLVVSGT
jgi:hypothetical protein